ncbi:bifunctional precorrin-2 dehydrogenase/sirohydrochlorin ferrochelatase [Brevibacillus fluminis]|uniref:precorrin-2 dehydrogenase n=1 Tax=Brevibacillus fluminis TaxID=511487 RepID=A0A3M8DT30_9BACL|nr:bifunctional precorrin-2 dehydrogenase/sirohydrochlorin ferrochelatase [Brevibacillus fluminis]RNB90531.1 bifunctional precorrin-2 dehydrogenase/sirohydrochlorin ferrochelatase [Brevibacillus fluminis]
MDSYFPIVIDIHEKKCLVVGGGEVATRKVESLLQAGADVTVISPEAGDGIREWAQDGRLHWRNEAFSEIDVTEFAFVIAATNQSEVNHAVYHAVRQSGGWVNIVDRPDLCNFILPSVVKRGKLTISVSTSGASPGLARKIKQTIEQEIGPEYEEYVDFLARIRQQVLAEVGNHGQRKKIFRELLQDRFIEASEAERYAMAAELVKNVAEEYVGRQL